MQESAVVAGQWQWQWQPERSLLAGEERVAGDCAACQVQER